MRNKVQRNGRQRAPGRAGLNSLYIEFLKRFYDQGDREQAGKIAARLEKILARSAETANSIRGEEIRSLIAELRGNYAEAIRSREAEIRKILELHSLAVGTPNWDYVSRQYDFSDVSDRLDLLAILYDQHGESDRARAVLVESKQYCEAHHVPFDGQDLLNELEQAERAENRSAKPRVRKRTAKR